MFQMFGAAVVNSSDEKLFLIKREFYLARNGLYTVWGQQLLVIKKTVLSLILVWWVVLVTGIWKKEISNTGKLGKNSKSFAENLTHDPPSSSSDALAIISMPVIEVYMRILM